MEVGNLSVWLRLWRFRVGKHPYRMVLERGSGVAGRPAAVMMGCRRWIGDGGRRVIGDGGATRAMRDEKKVGETYRQGSRWVSKNGGGGWPTRRWNSHRLGWWYGAAGVWWDRRETGKKEERQGWDPH